MRLLNLAALDYPLAATGMWFDFLTDLSSKVCLAVTQVRLCLSDFSLDVNLPSSREGRHFCDLGDSNCLYFPTFIACFANFYDV